MTTQPSNSDSPKPSVPQSVLNGALQDEQLRAAARSWHALPQLTRDKMLERAARIFDDEPVASDDTHSSKKKETDSRLPRPKSGSASGKHESTESAKRRQAPPPSPSSSSGRRSSIQAMPPGPARRRALMRLFVSLGSIAVVFSLVYWYLQPTVPIPDNLLGRADMLMRSAAKGRSGEIRRLSWSGTDGDAIAFGLEVRGLLPEKFLQSEESPLRKYHQLSAELSEHMPVRVSIAIPVDQEAHPDLPAEVPVILFWQHSADKGWLLNGHEARANLSRALKSARRATQSG
ncbi:MAG: hypothetical protein B7Z55_01145 [Planctomycetales bacterium 12-60-4]|nr:MAG: hypothetical protein B7Z55_01145 [Planctomycetales bacterium 12-60-4]